MYFILTAHLIWDWPHLSAQGHVWLAGGCIMDSSALDGQLHFTQPPSLSDITGPGTREVWE